MFASIWTNHFLRWELRHTTTSAKGIKWSFILVRVIPLTFLTLVALIPVFYYIDETRLDWLGWMALILFVPRPLLIISTIVAAVGSVKNEMNTPRWELLILTGILAPKIVWGKWVGVVRQTAADHILFSLPHMGLALGIAEYLNVMNYPTYPRNWPSILSAYLYNGDWLSWSIQLYPSVIVSVIGCFVIVLFGFLECGLVAAIGLAMAFVWKQRSFIVYIASSGYYIILILFMAIIWNYLYIGSRWSTYMGALCDSSGLLTCDFNTFQSSARITDTIQLGFQTPIDQGTLLSANIMRPNDTRVYELKSYQTGEKYLQENNYDNRSFVARNILAALLGTGIYVVIIRYFLRRATRFAIVNHGASGYLEL
jgi:hypothetical protein